MKTLDNQCKIVAKQINFIPSDGEMKILEDYCLKMKLSKTAVLRQLIRKLGEEETAAKAAQSLQGG
jgi:hypothetical protein